MMGLELQGLNVYEKVMTVLLIIYAFMVNISTSAVSICICLGVLTILLQYYKTGNIPCVNKYIILAVSIYVLTGMISNTINVGGIDGIKMWIGHTYRFFPMFYAQTKSIYYHYAAGILTTLFKTTLFKTILFANFAA